MKDSGKGPSEPPVDADGEGVQKKTDEKECLCETLCYSRLCENRKDCTAEPNPDE